MRPKRWVVERSFVWLSRFRRLGRDLARRDQALEAYRLVSGYVQVLRSQGLSLQQVADRLNAEGHRTVMGKLWYPTQVRNLLLRPKV